MTQHIPLMLVVVVATALIFDFVNGWNDSANAIATVISTRVLSPGKALIISACLNMAGAFAGTEVAKTITSGIVKVDAAILPAEGVLLLLACAMVAAIIWAAWMTVLGMPISGSHSLIGGLVGGALAAGGTSVIIGAGITKVLVALLLSPLLGGVLAFLISVGLLWTLRNTRPRTATVVFSPLQVASSSVMAFNHGLNDAQKVMGVITMALVATGLQQPDLNGQVHPLFWVKVACGVMISLGTAIGGVEGY